MQIFTIDFICLQLFSVFVQTVKFLKNTVFCDVFCLSRCWRSSLLCFFSSASVLYAYDFDGIDICAWSARQILDRIWGFWTWENDENRNKITFKFCICHEAYISCAWEGLGGQFDASLSASMGGPASKKWLFGYLETALNVSVEPGSIWNVFGNEFCASKASTAAALVSFYRKQRPQHPSPSSTVYAPDCR